MVGIAETVANPSQTESGPSSDGAASKPDASAKRQISTYQVRPGAISDPASGKQCPAEVIRPPGTDSLRDDLLNDLARDVGQTEATAVVLVGQPSVIDAQQVQNRGVQVVDVNLVDCRFVADLV